MIRPHALLLLLLAPWVSSCAAPRDVAAPAKIAGPSPMTESPNPIQATRVSLTHTVHFAPGAGGLDPQETAALADFLAQSDAAAASSVLVLSASAASGDGRVQRLADALARQGFRPQVKPAMDAPVDAVRLEVERYEASVPNCPNWSKPPGNDFANTLHSDFGCATATNLAAMVADPRDLVVGRTLGPAEGDPAVAALERYRAGKTTQPADQGASASQTFTIAPGGAPAQ